MLGIYQRDLSHVKLWYENRITTILSFYFQNSQLRFCSLSSVIFIRMNCDDVRSMLKVWDDVTLKDLKDQLNEIKQRLDHRDTRRVEYVWYERPSFDSEGRLTFSRPELTNNDDVSSMFSTYSLKIFPRVRFCQMIMSM